MLYVIIAVVAILFIIVISSISIVQQSYAYVVERRVRSVPSGVSARICARRSSTALPAASV